MSKRSIALLAIGFVCGGGILGAGMLAVSAILRVQVVATWPVSPPPQDAFARSSAGGSSYALDGYCPVTLVQKQQWVLGNSQYREKWGTQVFLFAGSAEQRQFQQQPERYAPALSGNDVVLAKEGCETARGKREHGVFCRGRIYLFASEASLQRFAHNPGLYVSGNIDEPIDGTTDVSVGSKKRDTGTLKIATRNDH